jgi:outer membrane receptor for ferrienterochelin and colicins
MKVPHFSGAPNQSIDEITEVNPFSELSMKFGYSFNFKKPSFKLECYFGVKNILNSYQEQFDVGKNRDSNFIFGPAQPRTFFVGIKLMSK